MKKAFGIGAICVAFTAVASTSLTLFAQDKKGLLAELPSKPGAHVEKIGALGDDEWLKLGAPAADPKWGKARGSSWGAKASPFNMGWEVVPLKTKAIFDATSRLPLHSALALRRQVP